MLNKEENDLLTRVEGDAPMGRLMRENYWFPFALTSQLVADGKPLRVKLLGRDYVAFRATDGNLGVFDERCPHRGASLALARNEQNGLRCIFHGWKFNSAGRAVEITTEPTRAKEYAERVKVKTYPVRESGGLAWVWLGEAESGAPRFPELPFSGPHEGNTWLTVTVANCNWLQGVEGTLDSVHVGTLHQSWIGAQVKRAPQTNIAIALDVHPYYEVENAPYGIRAAALRGRADGSTYVRVTEYFMPFVSAVPAVGKGEGTIFIVTPIDDTHHLLFFGLWSEYRKKDPEQHSSVLYGKRYDRHNFAPLAGGRDQNWGQDRTLMAAGHFSGFGNSILEEDMVVQASMGAIADRSEEMLSVSDVAIVRARRMLLEALRGQAAGKLPPGSALAAQPPVVPSPLDAVLKPGVKWQDFSFEQDAA
jgi:phthalate 4,5-dioxygenase